MNEKEEFIASQVVDGAIKIHKEYGPGLLESVYEWLLIKELQKRGLNVEQQKPIPLEFDGKKFDAGFRVDIWIEPGFVVELKSVETIAAVHMKQVLTYLRLTKTPIGLLINFGDVLLKNGIRRVLNSKAPQPPTDFSNPEF